MKLMFPIGSAFGEMCLSEDEDLLLFLLEFKSSMDVAPRIMPKFLDFCLPILSRFY